jgi:hypothetical protein
MIPTKANIAKLHDKKRAKKPMVHQKISNDFIANAIQNNNLSALKTLYYLSTVLSEVDMQNMKDNKLIGIKISKRDMLKFTELSVDTIVKTTKQMQKTSITFFDVDDDGDKVIEGMSLLPRYVYVPNKDIVELDLYVKVAKMIVAVKAPYTQINIKSLMRISNMHTLRLLALLNTISRYDEEYGKRKHMTLDELNMFFGVNYKSWSKIEEKIIKPIQDELNSVSNLSFIYESNFDRLGRGRPKFKDVTIDVIVNKQPKLF